jgi:hypothetical protein
MLDRHPVSRGESAIDSALELTVVYSSHLELRINEG